MTTQTPKLILKFEPSTIQHLGVKLYSQLPLALAELISNSYDAGANLVGIWLKEENGMPSSIKIEDDGNGLTQIEINDFFLRIGRNRRAEAQDEIDGRPPTGKKGVGKLAAFGIANSVEITTCKNGRKTTFVMRYTDILSSSGSYAPEILEDDIPTKSKNGMTILLSELKRKSPFDSAGLANSLSKTFIFNDDFKVAIVPPNGQHIVLNNLRKYQILSKQFEWDASEILVLKNFADGPITGHFMTTEKPIPPNTRLRGISLFSRGKLVNAPEFYRDSTSSHFYSYLTGYLDVSFIENYSEDVISTNRQSLLWDNPILENLHTALSQSISEVAADWRKKRTDAKNEKISNATGIDTKKWVDSMPDDVKADLNTILSSLSADEGAEETSIIAKALHNILPEYPMLHWRHLHTEVKDAVKTHYENQLYAEAADQATKLYFDRLKDLTNLDAFEKELASQAFKMADNKKPIVQINANSTKSERAQQEGQQHLSAGLATSFRAPMAHGSSKKLVPEVFTELDCLNILSLVTYLLRRIENPQINIPE